ncbi:hypothetical protein M406DRAFT_108423 [Cryphonectria parasitica EP155]|uniref:Dystroglycan-type cadherin-like domain-containing protein n=1 Tax=Cryphonectria parasitica (strain ATCC 38755 / EP155) TaxID=660469 RepID=A0A9P4XV38_CRYP1|nr:uncharacterized protein M406DRAFT_108423 [Cryphonectria parasitica EP155]KAF3761175.1 hypothetical protein M406DRAFT_108423 [Cryphonectria parasitica EP155]
MLAAGRPSLPFLPLFFLSRAAVVASAPTLSFPLNSQVPPVARIGEPFSFEFSPSTFTSSSGSSLSYSLVDPPSWVSLDSESRTLYGTPEDGDIVDPETVVGVNITLVATDATGSTSDDATLVVSRNQGPVVQIPISDQIQGFGKYSEPSSILCNPEEDFKFTFAADTFSDVETSVLNYYTVMLNNNSPLPAWISFDPGTLALAGTTPPFSSLVEPPQTFSMKLIASDVAGFSAAWVNFSIVVGTHALTTSDPEVTLNATVGKPLAYDALAQSVQIDQKAVDSNQVNVTTEGMPSWLTLDPASWDISGTPPDDSQPTTTFMVTMEDAFADILNITFKLQVTGSSSLFQSTIPSLDVKPGGSLSFDLTQYLADPSAVDVTADIEPVASWLSWDASALTLTGSVPRTASESVIDVTFTAQPRTNARFRRDGTRGQSQELVIEIQSASSSSSITGTASSTSSRPASAPSTSSSKSSDDTTSSSSAKRSPNWTIVAIVISAVAAFALVACICFWFCHRKNKQQQQSRSDLDSAFYISAPLPESLIYTPGVEVGSPDPQHNTVSSHFSNEKDKSKPKKASNLRTELTPSPIPPVAPSLADIYNDDDVDDEQPPMMSESTTPANKLKGWYDSLRSFRVAHLRRGLGGGKARVSESFLSDDEGSHQDLDLDLEFAGPPVISLSHSSQGTFRNNLEVEVPTLSPGGGGGGDSSSSLQRVLDRSHNKNDRFGSLQVKKGKNTAVLPTPENSESRLPRNDGDASPTIGQAVSPLDERNPFNSHPISPISPPTAAGISASVSTGPPRPPPAALSSSSMRRPRAASEFQLRTQPALRPVHSQKSFASISSIDSMRGRTRRLAAKTSAQAKGAMSLASIAMKSPTRRTLARLGKKPSLHLRRSKRAHRGVLESVDDDGAEESSRQASVRSPAAGLGIQNGGGGIGAYLSPRLWPQPAGPGDSVSPVPMPSAPDPVALDSERHRRRSGRMNGSASSSSGGSREAGGMRLAQQAQNSPGIPRRPVASSPLAATASAVAASKKKAAGVAVRAPSTPDAVATPSPSAQGLGISIYEDIVSSSPFHPSKDGGDREGSWVTSQAGSTSELGLSLSSRPDLREHSAVPMAASRSGHSAATTRSTPGVAGTAGSTGPNWISFDEVVDEESPVIQPLMGGSSLPALMEGGDLEEASGGSERSGKSEASSNVRAFV